MSLQILNLLENILMVIQLFLFRFFNLIHLKIKQYKTINQHFDSGYVITHISILSQRLYTDMLNNNFVIHNLQ